MAHFAQMDGSTVTRVVVVHNNDAPDEAAGVAFCKSLFGADTEWLQCSYNANMRKNYPGIGYTFDAVRDAFTPPRPGEDWMLDENTCRWIDPNPPKNPE
jgi:hypothetical protein